MNHGYGSRAQNNNEQAWKKVLNYETSFHSSCPQPKLLKFRGRPNDLSPKARILGLFGYSQPFDRHDWIVDRCGREVRYIIDYYSGYPEPDGSPTFHVDVRPALDSFESIQDRLYMAWKEWQSK